MINKNVFFWANAEVSLVFPSASVIADDFTEKKPALYIHMNLDWTGSLTNTKSPSESKLCRQIPSWHRNVFMSSCTFFYLVCLLLLLVKPLFTLKYFFKKEAYSIQAITPQDHLIVTCSVKHTVLLTPVQEDGKQGNNKLNPFDAYFLILYLEVEDPLLLLQLPPITQLAIQLHWLCFCFALLLHYLIKVQMPLLIVDREENNTFP